MASRNATFTSLMVCCGFVVCWSPNYISFFLNSVGYAIDFSGWFYHFILNLVKKLSNLNFSYPSSRTPGCTSTLVLRPPPVVLKLLSFWFYHFTVVLVFTSSCINPLIYAAKYREFQNGVRGLASRLTGHPHQIQTQQGSISGIEMKEVAAQSQ